MSMKPHGLEPIPEETRRLVQRLCPKGPMVTQLRDALGPIYSGEAFAHLFPKRGRAAEAPWRLAMVMALQAIEGLTDRQAAESVRTRVDWLSALALPLDDPGFDHTILTDFRQRLLRLRPKTCSWNPSCSCVASGASSKPEASSAPMRPPCWRACAPSTVWKAWERACALL